MIATSCFPIPILLNLRALLISFSDYCLIFVLFLVVVFVVFYYGGGGGGAFLTCKYFDSPLFSMPSL